MINTIDFRTAWIGVSEINKTFVNKRKIEMTIDSTIPMVLINPALLVDNLINSKTTAIPALVSNTLVDELDPLRFTYITTTQSIITNNIVRLYHDKKFNDILVVPNLDNFGTGAVNDPNAGMRYEIKCRRIAGGDVLANEVYTGSISTNNTFVIPQPVAAVPSTHSAVKLNTISPNYGNRNGFYNIGTTTANFNLSDARQLPTGILDLGTTTSIFGSNVPLPLYQVYMSDIENYKLKNINVHAVPHFYIILDF